PRPVGEATGERVEQAALHANTIPRAHRPPAQPLAGSEPLLPHLESAFRILPLDLAVPERDLLEVDVALLVRVFRVRHDRADLGDLHVLELVREVLLLGAGLVDLEPLDLDFLERLPLAAGAVEI